MTYQHIDVSPLTPTIGAVIGGVDLNHATDAVYEDIKAALWKHHVVFLRDQPVTHEAYAALGRAFGDLETHEFFPHVEKFPVIQRLTHEGVSNPETDRWHTDVTFRPQPSLVTILRAVELPPAGGDTMWMSTGAAFDALGPGLQTLLASLRAEHDMPWRFRKADAFRRAARGEIGGNPPAQDVELAARQREQASMIMNPPSVHPAVIDHPVTGRRTLFVNSTWTKRLLDVHEDLSDGLLDMLFQWVKRPEFQVRFRWKPDSIAIWDNFATQHFAVHDYAPHRRVMHRMTAGKATPTLG